MRARNSFVDASRPQIDGASCEVDCLRPFTCPLSRVKAGMAVRIKELSAPPEVSRHLREIGIIEEQVIKLLIRQANLICQVCNTRLALSVELARMILVEPLGVAECLAGGPAR